MKDRPILFKGEMVRAILEGSKTQTRRPIKGDFIVENGNVFRQSSRLGRYIGGGRSRAICPYGQPGDRLWVRETWWEDLDGNVWYRADADEEDGSIPYLLKGTGQVQTGIGNRRVQKWRPSIHMPRWASRITLEITNVMVERIQEMGIQDYKAEGYQVDPADCFSDVNTLNKIRRPFMKSWNATYPGSWDRNDFVWVIEFKKI